MGGVCSGGTASKKIKGVDRSKKTMSIDKSKKSTNTIDVYNKNENCNKNEEAEMLSESADNLYGGMMMMPARYDSGELDFSISRELKPSTPARIETTCKVPQPSSFLGRAKIVGLERAVEVLDTLGSSMSNLNASGGFVSGISSRGNKVSILAFEVANTIAKGANLMHSLSEDNIQFLKNEILRSEGVQKLVSADMNELLTIAAKDKREEFDVFSKEVIRFGDLCKDPQWHNLGRFFSKLDSDTITHKQLKEEAEMTMQKLTTLAEHTSELYHELNALDRFVQDYRRKVESMDSTQIPQKGESIGMLQSELKQQKKLVRSLKRKSLWSRNLEEIVEKLVDVVSFIHQAILEAFRDSGMMIVKQNNKNHQRLGVTGLALHYASMINQIDNIASRPTSLPSNIRDSLYHGLPASVKASLRLRLQELNAKGELTMAQVKAEMEKTLQWLVPIATNTTRAHQGFGWVGEWANMGNEFNKKTSPNTTLIRLQTLYHADKQKTDLYILEIVTWLHHLISTVRHKDFSLKPLHMRSPTQKGMDFDPKFLRISSLNYSTGTHRPQLSQEDQNLLADVCRRSSVPGISKSQEFTVSKKQGSKVWALSRSTGNSPRSSKTRDSHQQKVNPLDIMDGLDSTV